MSRNHAGELNISKTVTCLYQDQQKGAAIVNRLDQAGISRSGIDVYSDASGNLTDSLENAGVPRSDAHAYAEGVRRGGSLVISKRREADAGRSLWRSHHPSRHS